MKPPVSREAFRPIPSRFERSPRFATPSVSSATNYTKTHPIRKGENRDEPMKQSCQLIFGGRGVLPLREVNHYREVVAIDPGRSSRGIAPPKRLAARSHSHNIDPASEVANQLSMGYPSRATVSSFEVY